jgi:hypothetical protein
MRRLIIEPEGWPCTLDECPPGLFMYEGTLAIKSAHPGMVCLKESPPFDTWKIEPGNINAPLADGGCQFWGGTGTQEELRKLEVQPCTYRWEKE